MDFIVEFIEGVVELGKPNEDGNLTRPQQEIWHLYMDDTSTKKGVGLGIHLEASFGNVDKSITLGFEAFNNETEYEALLHDLEVVQLLGTRKINVNFDSKLVVCQTLARYEAKDERMKPY